MKIIQLKTRKNGYFPNNPVLPVMLYKGALKLIEEDNEQVVKDIFNSNNWSNSWVNGIYEYHHYHSITHEVLGIINGKCTVMLGGEKGAVYKLDKGDVLIIPAGVAHKRIDASDNFTCMGAYPRGTTYDIMYGHAGELPEAEENIRKVPFPETDPVYGAEGPLFSYWKQATADKKN